MHQSIILQFLCQGIIVTYTKMAKSLHPQHKLLIHNRNLKPKWYFKRPCSSTKSDTL